jgi:hypothetical protein
MGSIDIGPTYLGKGEMATAPAATRRDLRKALLGARSIDVPLVIGSAGSAGAAPHLEATLAIIRDIARADGLHFRLGVLRADLSRDMLRASVRAGRVSGIDDMPALIEDEVTEATQIVGQMGMGPFRRALAEDIDMLVAGRACDTAIFASLPTPRCVACRVAVIRSLRRSMTTASNWKAWPSSGAQRRSRWRHTACMSRLIPIRFMSRKVALTSAAPTTRQWTIDVAVSPAPRGASQPIHA